MSYGTKDIGGDFSVGRNLTAGGNVTARGNARVGHNLRVDGWLEAPNIVGPLKGLYASGTSLKEAYPEPRPGWWALVGATLPADVWRAERDERGRTVWRATGEKGGELALYPERIESAVAELRDDVRGVEGRLTTGVAYKASETYGTLSLTLADGTAISVGIPGMTDGNAGLMTPTRLAAIRSEMTQTAIDALLGVSYETFDDHGTLWLTMPSGNRKGVGIPGMTEGKAGLLTPARLESLRSEMRTATSESVTGIEVEQLDTFARIWSTTQGGRRSIATLLTAMDGETAGLYSPTRHRQVLGLIEKASADGLARDSEAVTFTSEETYGRVWIKRADGTLASAVVPGMTDGKAGLMTPTRLAALRGEIAQTTADAIASGTYEAFEAHGTIWLTLPSGNRKGIGIPGMSEGKAGLLTPARLEAIRAEIREASGPLATRLTALEGLIGADSDGRINRFNEIVSFMAGVEDTETLEGILTGIATQAAAKADKTTTERALADLRALVTEAEERLSRENAELRSENAELRERLAATDGRLVELAETLQARIGRNETAIERTATEAAADNARLRAETGILPFDGIAVNEEDAAWEALSEGSTAYLTEAGHFKMKSDRLTSGLADYNEEGEDGAILARRDRLFRLGNRLYSFDGTALAAEAEPQSISEEEIAAAVG